MMVKEREVCVAFTLVTNKKGKKKTKASLSFTDSRSKILLVFCWGFYQGPSVTFSSYTVQGCSLDPWYISHLTH